MFSRKTVLVVLIAATFVGVMGDGIARARSIGSVDTPLAGAATVGGEIAISTLDNDQFLPAVAYNWKHGEYLVVWHNTWTIGTRDVRAQRVSAQGQLVGPEFVVYENATKDSAQPSVAYDPVNDRYLVVWTFNALGGSNGDWDIYGRFIPWNGPSASLTEFQISFWTTQQWNPRVAYGRAQEEFLIVWTNINTSGPVPAYVSARRVKASDGTFFDAGAGGFTVTSHTTENRVNPDVAYNLARNEYLVVADNVFDIFGVRLRGDGVALGGGEFGIAGWPDQEQHPAVAACNNADQYLVAWQSLVAPNNNDVYARFVTGSGTPDSVHVIEYTSVAEVEPDVACNTSGQQYLVVWQEQFSNASGPYGAWGRLVFPDTHMEAAFGIIAPFGGGRDRTNPAVAGGASNYLVVWEHGRDGTSYQDVHGRLVTPYMVYLPLMIR